jgi:RHS repeat-associated protein
MSKRIACWLVLLASAAATGGCAGPAPTPATPEVVAVRSAVTSAVDVSVVDASANPQPGVQVTAEDQNGTPVVSGTTDSQGHVTFTLDEGAYRFVTPGAGTIELVSGPPGHCVVPSCTSATITITQVAVTVVDADGNPQQGALVGAEDENGTVINTALTDAAGHATLGAPQGAYRFVVPWFGVFEASGLPGHCAVPMCTAVSITVTDVLVSVGDGAFNPLPNVEVAAEAADGTYVNTGSTDQNGEVRLGVPAGAFRFTVQRGMTMLHSGPVGHCVVPGCRDALITVNEVDVTVVDADGTLQQGRQVAAQDSTGISQTSATTDDQGHAHVAVEPGDWRFVVVDHGVLFGTGPLGSCHVPGCSSGTITIHPVLISVVDTGGNPFAGQEVGALDASGAPQASAVTNASGVAEFWLGEGAYIFRTWIGPNQFWSGHQADCVLPSCLNKTITVNAPVAVTVQDPQGNAVPNQTVLALSDEFSGEENFADTDQAGHVAFVLPDGGWRFKASCGSEQFYSGSAGQCVLPGCTAAQIVMVCGTCAGQADGTPCDDRNACTRADTCQSGVCVGSNPITCTAQDQCHVAGTCDSTTGACTNPPVPDGAACNDGNACSRTDTCQGGVCAGSSFVTCAAQDQCHSAGRCDPATGACTNPVSQDGTACNDGNPCTRNDTCQAGTCAGGSAVTCTALDQCHDMGTCNPATGACTNPFKSDGTACDDGNACTLTDTCQLGICIGSGAVTCVASDQCHAPGACNPSTGTCSAQTAKPNGTACDDGNACSHGDTCQGGVCNAGNNVVCVAQDQCHSAGTCDPATGVCSNPAKSDGATCNDGDACTRTDTCQSGRCAGSNTVTCVAQDQCHDAGTCDKGTGLCPNPAKTNGAACDDGNTCTTGDTCESGVCVSGGDSCQLLTIVHTLQTTPRLTVNMSATLTPDRTAAVPGDVVAFTAQVTNTGMLFELGNGSLAITNNSASAVTVHGFKETLEYFSLTQQVWVPFASFARDNNGASVPSAPLLAINPLTLTTAPNLPGITHVQNETMFGTAIQPGATGTWGVGIVVLLTPGVENVIFDPAQAAGFRAVFHVDTSGISGEPPEVTGAASAEGAFDSTVDGKVDGKVNGLTATVDFLDQNPSSGPLAPASDAALAPGASMSFSGTVPAGTIPSRGSTEQETAYRSRLLGAGYRLRLTAKGSVTHAGSGGANVVIGLGMSALVPALKATKTSLTQQPQAGFTNQFGVTLQNVGTGAAGPFYLNDGIVENGATTPVSATVISPPTVAAGQVGAATIQYQIPLDRPAGDMTDSVSVLWQDGNHNVYGPVSSSLTAHVQAGQFQGEILLSGDTGLPDVVGTAKNLTATVLDANGNPVASLPVHLAITGPNSTSLDLTTGPDGTVTFSYTGANKGLDTAVATATIVSVPASSNTAHVNWVGDVPNVTECTGREIPLDVLLLIDASSSMEDEGKIEAAKRGAKSFIDLLDFSRDQVAVASFAIGAGLNIPLNKDAAATKAAIDGITLNFFTNIGAGLDTARLELTGPRHNPGATPVIVFLSDGGNSFGDPGPAITALKSSGIRTVTIGLGSDIDGPELRTIASAPSEYFYAPSSDDLSWIYATVGQDVCRNRPPLVRAGGNQGAYGVQLPHELELQGEVHDDGPPGDPRLVSQWTKVSGPGTVTFGDASSPVTTAFFTEPGTYVLELAASDGFLISADRATITVDDEPSLAGASLTVALDAAGPLQTGQQETLRATLLDAQSHPVQGFAVQINVAGANARTAAVVTDANGVATFTYVGALVGGDVLNATALGTPSLTSSSVSVTWNLAGTVVTQGWIGAPLNGAVLTGQKAIAVADGVTLTSGTVTYWPSSSPGQVTTLATGVSGASGDTLATLDTTLLANGSYVVRLDATNSGGTTQTSLVLVIVAGDYKPGRVVVEMVDFTIPLQGLPITIGRRYDSLERDKIGDFGYGWSLLIGHPRLEVDPGYNVTMTMQNGRRATFQFAPTFPAVGPVIFGFMLLPAYQPAPGVYGKLTADGCGLLTFDPFAQNPTPICFDSLFDPNHLAYAPTTYTYTDPYGTVYTMGATGELRSIKDRQNNTLTFSPTGITSSSGDLTVTFTRDGQGRISDARTPIFDLGGGQNIYRYGYDGNGDLATVTLPDDAVTTHTYDPAHAHLLATTKDPRGNMARTSTYDADGRLATDTDAMGNLTTYAYELGTHTTTTTNPDHGVVTEVFDEQGMVLLMTDPLSHTTQHFYDSNRNELKRIDALNELNETTTFSYDRGNQETVTRTIKNALETTTTHYDAFSLPHTRIDPLNHTTTFTYDDSGVPVRIEDDFGLLAKFTSSDHGLPLTATDAAGAISYFTYDLYGNQTSKTDRLGRLTKYEYDGIGRLLATTDPRGGRTENHYNPRGTIRTTTDALGYVHGFGYDKNDNKVHEEIDGFPQGFRTYQYDALNHLIDIEWADHTHTSYTRDFRGNPLTMTDQLGRVTTYEYDKAGRLLKTIYPRTDPNRPQAFTQRSYDELGRLKSTTDENGHETKYEYQVGCDCSERLTKITDPLKRVTLMDYDGAGHKISATDPAGHTTTYLYNDIRGRFTDTVYADQSVQHYEYDSRNRRLSVRDQISTTHTATTQYGYDDEGQLTSVTDPLGLSNPLGHVTSYQYDGTGNLTQVTDANGHITKYEYDLLGRKTRRTLPLGLPMGPSETFEYDPTVMTAHVDFRGKRTRLDYDAMDRLRDRIPDDSLGEPTESYTYYDSGTRHTMGDSTGTNTTSYTYDDRDRVRTKATPAGTLSYGWDDAGNLLSIDSSNTNGTSVAYTWDAANQLQSITDNHPIGGVVPVTVPAFTPTGHPDTLTQPNGVKATYEYSNVMDRVTRLTWKQGANPLASWGYSYNDRGQRLTSTATTNNNRTATYEYDDAARLTKETITGDPRGSAWNGAVTYTLDNVGNRLTRSAAAGLAEQDFQTRYDANDALLVDGDHYDTNGNLTTSGGETFAYDFRDRLKAKNANAPAAVTLTYDCDGNRFAKAASGVTTQYLVDDLNPTGFSQVLEELVGGAVKVRFTYGNSIVSQTRDPGEANTTSFYGYDAQGNITFLTDGNGTITDTYAYDAWGNVIGQTGTTTNTRLYTGEELDPDLGLFNLRGRQYRASTGRFVTVDLLDAVTNLANLGNGYGFTVGSSTPRAWVKSPYAQAVLDLSSTDERKRDRLLGPIGLHKYLYANVDPVNLGDPLGLAAAVEAGATLAPLTAPLIPAFAMQAGDAVIAGSGLAILAITIKQKLCSEMYNQEIEECKRKRSAKARQMCFEQAMERYAACLAGRRLPPKR